MDSSYVYLGLFGVFCIILFSIGMYNSDSAYLDRAADYGQTMEKINNKMLLEKHAADTSQANLMLNILERTAREALNLDITMDSDSIKYLPFRNSSDIKPLREGVEICDLNGNIPYHLYDISKTQRFKDFAAKYSGYHVTLFVNDERVHVSSMHYGLSAISQNNKTASTYFHVNTCTGKITDTDKYFLMCGDEQKGATYALKKKDVIASLRHSDFCTIPS